MSDAPQERPRILVVEDDSGDYQRLRDKLQDAGLVPVHAPCVNAALNLIMGRVVVFAAVILDGQLPYRIGEVASFNPEVVGLIRGAGFTGPIVAASNLPWWRRDMVEADPDGNTYDSTMGKYQAPRVVTQLLAGQDPGPDQPEPPPAAA